MRSGAWGWIWVEGGICTITEGGTVGTPYISVDDRLKAANTKNDPGKYKRSIGRAALRTPGVHPRALGRTTSRLSPKPPCSRTSGGQARELKIEQLIVHKIYHENG